MMAMMAMYVHDPVRWQLLFAVPARPSRHFAAAQQLSRFRNTTYFNFDS
jgi:hypothetical protein